MGYDNVEDPMSNDKYPDSKRFHNLLHTCAILLAMGGLFGLLGWMIFGLMGLFMALMLTFLILLSTPRITPPMVLKMYGARQLSFADAPGLYAMASELSKRAGLPSEPQLYYVPSTVMNAFSVGTRQSSAIALSDRLLRGLSHRELTGVLAHEIGHISNNDLRLHAFADIMTRITSLLSFMGQLLVLLYLPVLLLSGTRIPIFFVVLLIFAPSASMLLQLALSRNREYTADVTAVSLSNDPEGLASALQKMDSYDKGFWDIVPLPGRKPVDPSILRTHPNTRERVKRIMRMEREEGRAPDRDDRNLTLPGHLPPPRPTPRWNWLQPWR
jgi:heat shock protein HtpX